MAIISPDECFLIAETRLGDVSLHVAAEKLGISAIVARTWRRKAEKRLTDAIRSGELRRIMSGGTFDRDRDADARLNGVVRPDDDGHPPIAVKTASSGSEARMPRVDERN